MTLQGSGRVRTGATDYGATNELYAFGQYEVDLPATFTFCWAGRQAGGYGFETVGAEPGYERGGGPHHD